MDSLAGSECLESDSSAEGVGLAGGLAERTVEGASRVVQRERRESTRYFEESTVGVALNEQLCCQVYGASVSTRVNAKKKKVEHSVLNEPSEHSRDERSKLAAPKCITGSTCQCLYV